MARIAGINIPMNKHVWVGLTHIFGVGRTQALKACAGAGIKPNVIVKDLTESEVTALRSPRDVDEHQAPDGPRLLPRHPSPSRPAAARPAHAHQRAHTQGPAQGGDQDELAGW
jgi:hypothetical protein